MDGSVHGEAYPAIVPGKHPSNGNNNPPSLFTGPSVKVLNTSDHDMDASVHGEAYPAVVPGKTRPASFTVKKNSEKDLDASIHGPEELLHGNAGADEINDDVIEYLKQNSTRKPETRGSFIVATSK